jgi:MoxR-like ATPase
MASTRAPELAGREEELAAIAAFLAARDELPGALLLEGEAGIGKTTLFELALAAARDLRVQAEAVYRQAGGGTTTARRALTLRAP